MNAEDSKNKESENTEEKFKKEGAKNKLDRQGSRLLIFLVIILIVFIVIFSFRKEIGGILVKQENFDYHGLQFFKTKVGDITFYATDINLSRAGTEREYQFYFRTDPRDLDKINFNIISSIKPETYVSFYKSAIDCQNISLVAWNIGDFLGKIGSKVTGAMAEPEIQNQSVGNSTLDSKEVINCSSNVNATIIVVRANAEKTRVYQDSKNKNCFVLEAQNCDLIKVADRFILGMVVNAVGK